MPRNKHSEETNQKILDASLKLFVEKGYEQTSILDIVAELGGLTRGAFYHHFKSKEEVLDVLSKKLFVDDNPFEKVKMEKDLNGLEKIKWVLEHSDQNVLKTELNLNLTELLNSPTFLKKLLDDNKDILVPLFEELMREGMEDGSLQVKNAKLAAELFVLTINFWTIPTIFPNTEKEGEEKLLMIKQITDAIGLPVFDGETFDFTKKFLNLE